MAHCLQAHVPDKKTGQDRTREKDMAGQGRTGQDRRKGQERSGKDRTAQHRTAQDRTGEGRRGLDRAGQHRTGQGRIGQDSNHVIWVQHNKSSGPQGMSGGGEREGGGS